MNINLIKTLCQTSEEKLFNHLLKLLQENEHYNPVEFGENYIIAQGELPICVIAHLDTVFHELPHDFIYDPKRNILINPGGAGFDDRAGVYLILQLIASGLYPSIVFTRGEEIGGIGASDLITNYPNCPFEDCRAIIQLDRAYRNDAVFYECDNKDFENYICRYGFKFEWGTFTDISIIAPRWEIAAVNLSVGYVNEHTPIERLYCDWTDETLKKIKRIVADSKDMKSYAYIPFIYQHKKYVQEFSSPYEDDICLTCGNRIKVGRRIYQPDFASYNVCEECFKSYFEPETPNVVISFGQAAEEPPFG